MTKVITDAEIARLAELESKATAGPWDIHAGRAVISTATLPWKDIGIVDSDGGILATSANGQLIAESRNALPKLLDNVRRLKEALAIARRWMNNPEPGNSSYHWELYADEQSIAALVDE